MRGGYVEICIMGGGGGEVVDFVFDKYLWFNGIWLSNDY